MRPFSHSSIDSPWIIRDTQAIWKMDSLDGQVELEIDLNGAQPTIRQLCCLGKTLPGNLLGVTVHVNHEEPGWSLESVYQRSSDLIATYQNSAIPQCSLQINWQVTPALTFSSSLDESSEDCDRAFLNIDMVISLHTESLESYPQITTKSQLACDQLLYLLGHDGSIQPAVLQDGIARQTTNEPGCAVYRFRDLPWSYLEMVYPADFVRWQGNLSTEDLPLAKKLSAKDPSTTSEQISCWNLDCNLLEKGVIRRLQLRAILLPKHNDKTLALRSYAKFIANKPPLG
jgi:hypothetical protein